MNFTMEDIRKSFMKASRLNSEGYFTKKEWEGRESAKLYDGISRFKRKAFGLGIQRKKVKSLDKMAKLLRSAGIVSSLEDGRNLTPSLVGIKFSYGNDEKIFFEQVQNIEGNTKYRLSYDKYEMF